MFTGYSPAKASEPLLFNYSPNPLEQKYLHLLTENSDLDNYEIAAVDLNKDGVQEFILKNKTCNASVGANKHYCQYMVAAFKNDKEFMSLGEFTSKTLILSNNFFKGIRDLHVYNRQENDYDYNIARWNPEISGYEIIRNGT